MLEIQYPRGACVASAVSVTLDPMIAVEDTLSITMRAAAGALGLVIALVGCSSPDEAGSGCVDVSLACQPIVSPPTFDALYKNVFSPMCASAGCHGAGFSGGLDMRTVDSAFQGLSARSRPDAVGCSTLVRRVEASESTFRMPLGPTPLSEPQRCAIRQWIANGAKR